MMEHKSKYLSLLLRHKPEKANITVNEYGWAPTKQILSALNLNFTELITLVETDDKKRYAFNEDMSMVRANQGHSIKVKIDMDPFIPKEGDVLYHGTVDKFIVKIMLEGLKPMNRQFVHLSGDLETATKIGSRRGNPVILQIDAWGLHKRDINIYKSLNGVYQVLTVPPEFIKVI
jgi:putative RNA 2'-phosphotransferase